jgi:hypothetical protein
MKRCYFIIIPLFFIIGSLAKVYAKTSIHPALLSSKYIHSLTSEAAKGKSYPAGLNNNKFFPIGFSEKGLFAYILDYSDGGCGYCPYLVVLNLVNDEQIVRQFFEGKIDTTQASKILFDWEIQDFDEKNLTRFPAVIGEDQFDVHVECSNLILSSKLRGRKQVSNLDSLQGFYLDYKKNDLLIEGFLKSPLEKRIVIILSGLYYGFEGEVDLFYFTVGAHLEKGFK